MKTLNAKRIAAVVAGAALLGVGLAFAGPITFQNVPIISNSGQPVVQIVVGSQAKAWDGVTAANIAAAIGNLAYTSVPVTATVNQTQANKVLKVAVTSSSYALSNQQVWLNESGAVGTSSGTYVFSSLIGSVLNGAVILNSPQNEKSLQGAGQYAFPQTHSLTSSPTASPYTNIGFVPISTSVTANNNGGGVQFTSFSSGTNDNLMEVTNSQYSGLLSNWGGNGESSMLWLTGFPVYDQATGINNFQLLDAAGAYQVTFSTPIQNTTGSNNININAPIKLLGQNYTILTAVGNAGGSTVISSNTVSGGKIKLASTLTPLQTVYVGHNITSGPWTVQLQDLGQPTGGGISPASIAVLYNNVLTNTSSIYPGNTVKFNVTGKTMFVNVNQTFAGLYAYQKWAKLQMYTNVFNLTDGKVFNLTTNPGWYARLLWTNTSSSSLAQPRALQSIIIYNTSPVNLAPGQSFTFIQNPKAFKVTFLGDTLSAANFDTVTVGSSTTSPFAYTNVGTAVTPGLSITNITEPAQELTVTSQIPNAFSYVGQVSSQVIYDLTPYKLTETGNAMQVGGANAILANNNGVAISYTGSNAFAGSNFITSTYPLLVTITGFTSNTATSSISQTLTFNTNSPLVSTGNQVLGTTLYNVTMIQLSRALPGTLSVTVNALSLNNALNTVTLATLSQTSAPMVIYSQAGKTYQGASLVTGNSIIYNQQNGQPTNAFTITAAPSTAGGSGGNIGQYFQFGIGEVAVPSNTAATDNLVIGIDNNSAGVVATPLFQLNYSTTASFASGTKNNVTYGPSSQGSSFNVQAGFRTERGSKVTSITPSLVTFSLAKLTDQLQFSVSAANSTTTTTKSFKLYGPYTVGQATNIANVSIGPVTANITISGNSVYKVSGIANLTATPSVPTATQPVLLRNLTTTPLVVLDSQANSGSNLILIGSGFVNTLSQQLQQAYNISMQPTTQLTQAYGTNRVLIAGYYANQTNAAGNSFIQQLYSQAH